MEEEILYMSNKEIERCSVIQAVVEKRMKQKEAAGTLHVSARQIRNLQKNYLKEGNKGLISKKRGCPSNHCYKENYKREVIEIIQKILNRCGTECGPTLIQEKLEELYQIKISTETIRQWMIAIKLWIPERHKKKKVHQRRERRSCFGEMIQIDASDEHWFGKDFSRTSLIAFVDDATSAITSLHMCQEEGREGYFRALQKHLDTYGKPKSIYSDRHSSLKINHLNAAEKGKITQFQRALRELGIDHIHAYSPQAKGRVERCFSTLQSRLKVEFKQRNITTIEQANKFLEEYRQSYNKKFAKKPAAEIDLHRPVDKKENLQHILCMVEEKKIGKELTFQYNNVTYQLDKANDLHHLKGKYVKICTSNENNLVIMYEGEILTYRCYEEEPKGRYYDVNHNGKTFHHGPKPSTHPWKQFVPYQKNSTRNIYK